jgi:membrane-bound lytic murein transglycosylase B
MRCETRHLECSEISGAKIAWPASSRQSPTPAWLSSPTGAKDHVVIAILPLLIAAILAVGSKPCAAAKMDSEDISGFVEQMSSNHGFERDELIRILGQARISREILEAISRPTETKPWYQYRPIFVTTQRADEGVAFWKANASALENAERRFGIPPEIVVAIIGVETFYGRNAGRFRVIDALVTLGFAYPKRADFFRRELEQYLLLTREQGLSPLALTGSYAGAMGMPQFIASSYRAYAVDFDEDGFVNIWDDGTDVVGSVANYLATHGWDRGGSIAVRARLGKSSRSVEPDLKPSVDLETLRDAGIEPEVEVAGNPRVAVIELDTGEGFEYWLGFHNFYTITRYNHSALYAMAVFQLSELIRAGFVDD